jgi:2-oxoisovalerate ferredoxin oxidoreductase beta subunit
VLSACPTGWKQEPVKAAKWVLDEMTQIFPLGVLRDRAEAPVQPEKRPTPPPPSSLPQLLGLQRADAVRLPVPRTPAQYADPRLKIAGFGGQGVLLLGMALAEAGMRSGLHVSWLPSYGPEMRGGTAHCHVNLSARRIGSPLVSRPTVLMALNGPSLEKFLPEVEPKGIALYNLSLIPEPATRADVEMVGVPATELADKLGSTLLTNMVMIGAYIEWTQVLSPEAARTALGAIIKRKELLESDLKAIDAGIEWAKHARATKSGGPSGTR